MNQHPETSSLSKYIPLYLQQATKNDHVCVAIMFNSYNNVIYTAEIDAPVLLHCTGEAAHLSVHPNNISKNGDRY